MPGAGRSFADTSDVLSDLSGQIVYVMMIPIIVPYYGTALGNSRHFTAKQKKAHGKHVIGPGPGT